MTCVRLPFATGLRPVVPSPSPALVEPRGAPVFNVLCKEVDASEVRMEWTARERIRNKTAPPCCSINMGSLSTFLRAPKLPDRQRIHQKRNSSPLLFNKHGFTVSFPPRPPAALPIRSLCAPLFARGDGIVPPTKFARGTHDDDKESASTRRGGDGWGDGVEGDDSGMKPFWPEGPGTCRGTCRGSKVRCSGTPW